MTFSTEGQRIRLRAAIARVPNDDWQLEELWLDPPRAGEVRVAITHAGLCYSDEHVRHGGLSSLPIVGGHEGAGIVESVGAGVTRVAAGDPVILSFSPVCGHCHWCVRGRTNLCEAGRNAGTGMMPDGSFRFSQPDGTPIGGHCVLGTFAEYAVVLEDACVPVTEDVPLSVASLVSCGVLSGWGAATYAGKVGVGDTVIVIGAGGVGVNALQAAAHAGAAHVIAVDPLDGKRALALSLGATEAFASINAAAVRAAEVNPAAGGADVVLICAGQAGADMVTDAFAATGKGGTLVLASMSNEIEAINMKLSATMVTLAEKRIQGTLFGSANPMRDMPLLLGLYKKGLLKLDQLVSRTYRLDEINQGFADLREGRNLRGLIVHDHLTPLPAELDTGA